MEKVFGKTKLFFFFENSNIIYRKAIHSEQNFRNFIGKIMFIQGFSQKKKVLVLGQSYNSVFGFSSTCISQKEENFFFFYLDYVFIHI